MNTMTSSLTESEIAMIVEEAEAVAYVDLFDAAPAGLGCRAHVGEAATVLIAPSFDMPLFNRVLDTGVRAPVNRVAIDQAVALFRAAGLENFAVQVSPAAQPLELVDWLTTAGLSVRDRWTKTIRNTSPAPFIESRVRIEVVSSSEMADTFGRVACAAFGVPPMLASWLSCGCGRPGWTHYLAWDDDMPMATAALRVVGDVGWLGIAATLPSHRRLGAQGTLMVRRIEDAALAGCQWLVTETGEHLPEQPNPSFRNMMRLGFRVAYHRPNYMATR